MNSKTKVLLGGLIGVLLILGWMLWRTDWDARAIHGRLSELAELVEKSGPESTIETLGRARQLADFFTEDASVEYFPRRSLPSDREAFSGAFVSARGYLDTASVRLGHHEITVDESGERAESNVRVSARVVMAGGDEKSDTLNYRILWEKLAGEWRIRLVAAVRPD